MTHDPDILAIRRQRRQSGRCLHCARRTPRAALCSDCRTRWRYCPRCESLWTPDAPRRATHGRCSDYCLPCNRQLGGARQTRADWRAEQQRRVHPKLGAIIKLYRQGLTYAGIAAALGIPVGSVGRITTAARKTGRWPTGLMRHPRRKAT